MAAVSLVCNEMAYGGFFLLMRLLLTPSMKFGVEIATSLPTASTATLKGSISKYAVNHSLSLWLTQKAQEQELNDSQGYKKERGWVGFQHSLPLTQVSSLVLVP